MLPFVTFAPTLQELKESGIERRVDKNEQSRIESLEPDQSIFKVL